MSQIDPLNRSALRVLTILEWLALNPGAVALGAVAQAHGLDKSTAYRLMTVLERQGFASKEERTKQYTVGPKLLQLAARFRERQNVAVVGREVLEWMAATTEETASLAIHRGNEVMFVDKVDSPRPIRFYCDVGQTLPLHCGAIARIVLAHLPDWRVREYLESSNLTAMTRNTIVDPARLWEMVGEARRQGVTVSEEEVDPEVVGVAAPIFDYRQAVVGAVSLAGPRDRIMERLEIITRAIAEGARRISARMGYLNETGRSDQEESLYDQTDLIAAPNLLNGSHKSART